MGGSARGKRAWLAMLGGVAAAALAWGSAVAQPSPSPAVRAVDVAVGRHMACARMSDRSVRCWGGLGFLQGPDGASNLDRPRPVTIPGLAGAQEIALGESSGLALMRDGTVRSWGVTMGGRLGNGRDSTAPSGGGGGRVFCNGAREVCAPAAIRGLRDVAEIAAGRAHACARTRSGTVSCWGVNENGQVGDGTLENRASPIVVRVASRVTRIFAGADHTCALARDGNLYCWGASYTEEQAHAVQSPVAQAGASGVADASLGMLAMCTRGRAGVSCWGASPHGEVPDGAHAFRAAPTAIAALRGAPSLAMGALHGCARMPDRTVRCWGANIDGALGDGSTTQRFVPTPVPSLTGVEQVAAGDTFSCARTTDGRVHCWGRNSNGQLGDGTTTSRPTPAPVVW